MHALLFIASVLAPAGARAAEPPLATCCLSVPEPAPSFPGQFDTELFDDQQFGPFVVPGSGVLSAIPTAAWVVCTDREFCVHFSCTDPDIKALVATPLPHDSEEMWKQDSVEVFVAPGDPTKEYFHLVVSANGDLYDARVSGNVEQRDPSWESGAVTSVEREADGWLCTIRVPLTSLGGAPKLGDRWRLNLCREFRGGQALMSWAPLQGGFHEPAAFGAIVFRTTAPVLGIGMSPPFVGLNEASVSLAPEAKASARVEISEGGRTSAVPLGADGRYVISEEGQGTTQVAVEARGQGVIARGPVVRFDAPPMAAEAKALEQRLEETRDRAARLPAAVRDRTIFGEELRVALESVQSLRRWVEGAPRRPAARNQGRWGDQRETCRRLASTVGRLDTMARALSAAGGKGAPTLVIGTETSLRKLHPTDWDFQVAEPLRLAAARREAESAQVVVAPVADVGGEVARPLTQVTRVECSPLTSRSGARLDAGAVRIDRVGYVTTRPPVYPMDYVGEWPDPLMPLQPFALEPGRIQPLWVTVTVPADQEAGEYRGTLTVTDGGGGTASLPVELTVWDFELPLRGRLKTAVSTGYGDMAAWYGWQANAIPEEYLFRFYDLMLSHRLNPCCIYDGRMWPPIEHLDYCVARGLNSACMKCTGSATPEEIAEVRERLAALQQRGLADGAYIYGFDEAQPATWPDAKQVWDAWKAAIPEVKIAGTYPPNDVLNPVVDTWVPLTPWYDGAGAKDIAAARRAEGDEMWWYVCCGPTRPFQNWFIDFPATDHRGLFWATYKYGITGFLYYQTTMWASNMHTQPASEWEVVHEDPAALAAIEAGKRWPAVPWNTFTFSRFNGDGLLVYPGPNETPLASVRLANIRDGIEDYEMLGVLAALAQRLPVRGAPTALGRRAQELLAVNPDLVTDLTHFTTDPLVIEQERAKVAACILEVQEALATGRP